MRVALAWGCGSGSMLALDALLRDAHDVQLVHVLAPRSPPDFVVEEQAAALGLRLTLARPAPGEDEVAALTRALGPLGVERVAFGWVRGEEHAGWKLGKSVRGASVEPMMPARHLHPGDAARAFLDAGHRAFVRAAKPPAPREWLGRFLDDALADDVDGALGREGWPALRFLAVAGPRFARRVEAVAGDIVADGDGWRLELGLKGC